MENNVQQQSLKHVFKRSFLIALVTSLVVSAIAGIIIFLLGNFDDLEVKILFTTLVIGIFSLTGLVNASLLDKTQLIKIFGYYSLLISVFTALLLLFILWTDSVDQDQMAIDFSIASLSSTHISLLLGISVPNGLIKFCRILTIFFIIVVAGLLVYLYNSSDSIDIFGFNTFYYRILGVFAILDALGTITIPILNKINKS